jgi:hypothetical protein
VITDEMIEAAAKAAHEAQFPYPWVGGDGEYETDTRHEMRAALTAVLPLLQQDWQPIETAPKDGTEILACRMHEDCLVVMGVTSWGICRSRPDGYIAGDGLPIWRAYDPSFLFPTPTFWMPLPEPPKTKP